MFGFADRLGFRAIIYKCVEGQVKDRIVTAIDAAELALEGWSLSPAKAHPEEAMRDNSEYVQQCDMINTDRMRMINLPMISEKEALKETAERWLGLKLNPKHNLRSMKQRMVTTAKSMGVWEGENATICE